MRRWRTASCFRIALSPAVAIAAPATRPTTGPSTQPATAPAADDVDWLLSQGAPAAHPPANHDAARLTTKRPASPFAANSDPDLRHGIITLSNGERINGMIRHTQGKPLRAWVEAENQYRDVPFSLITRIEAKIDWERDEREWHFKESGSDIKEYSGKTYPARQMQYTMTLNNGQSITGGVVEPLYVQAPDGEVLFALHKRDKGDVGKSLKDLVYVKRVDFSDDAAGPERAAGDEGAGDSARRSRLRLVPVASWFGCREREASRRCSAEAGGVARSLTKHRWALAHDLLLALSVRSFRSFSSRPPGQTARGRR